MEKNKFIGEYKKALNSYLNCGEDSIFLYWKGRVALYAILKAMGVGPGDEVLIQGYSCVVVPNAVIYLGATPTYADISKETYNYDMDALVSKITPRTKVIICQNTYGLSSNLEKLQEIAKERGIYTIEDCTHGFSGTYNGKPNGSSCDASFFSSQWNKPFSTGIGGFSVIHNPALKDKVAQLQGEKVPPRSKETIELKLMYFVRAYLINSVTYWTMVRLYRFMSKHNMVVGSSSGEEVTGVTMPEGYFKDFSPTQAKKGLKSLKNLAPVNALRKKNAKRYSDFLESNGKVHVARELFPNHIFLKYPLLVKDRECFRAAAERAGVILGDWFESPIYPNSGDLSVWNVKTEEIPVAMEVCAHMVNLPADVKNIEKVISFLHNEIDQII